MKNQLHFLRHLMLMLFVSFLSSNSFAQVVYENYKGIEDPVKAKEAYFNDSSDFGKEHVSPYIVKKYGKNFFKIPNISKYNIDLSNFHYSVDTHDDFIKVKKIFDILYIKNNNFGLYDLLNYIQINNE